MLMHKLISEGLICKEIFNFHFNMGVNFFFKGKHLETSFN